ncbi:MAG: hypothetical protein LBK41_03650 [Clostridiales bacterium]|jgi:hypothetical protein|nr:hypothetical protein [Clostridiales bacterium]
MDAVMIGVVFSFIAGAAIFIAGLASRPKSGSGAESFEQISEAVFSELDEKKAELRTLYEMIGEKEKILKSGRKIDVFVGAERPAERVRAVPPMARRAAQMIKSGRSVTETAKELGIGQGEVRLMANLYGDGNA